MFKWAFRLTIILVLVLGVGYFLAAYRIIQTKSGLHIVEKDEMGFEDFVVDTREWNPMDYLKNPEISKTLAKIEWEKFGDRARNEWKRIKTRIDESMKSQDGEPWSDKAQERLEQLRKEAEKRYETLEKKWKNGDFSFEAFQKRIAELERWLDKKVAEIRAAF